MKFSFTHGDAEYHVHTVVGEEIGVRQLADVRVVKQAKREDVPMESSGEDGA